MLVQGIATHLSNQHLQSYKQGGIGWDIKSSLSYILALTMSSAISGIREPK